MAVAMKVVLVAACALVDPEGRVLIARRPAGKPMAGLWVAASAALLLVRRRRRR